MSNRELLVFYILLKTYIVNACQNNLKRQIYKVSTMDDSTCTWKHKHHPYQHFPNHFFLYLWLQAVLFSPAQKYLILCYNTEAELDYFGRPGSNSKLVAFLSTLIYCIGKEADPKPRRATGVLAACVHCSRIACLLFSLADFWQVFSVFYTIKLTMSLLKVLM